MTDVAKCMYSDPVFAETEYQTREIKLLFKTRSFRYYYIFLIISDFCEQFVFDYSSLTTSVQSLDYITVFYRKEK